MFDELRELLAEDYEHKHVEDARCVTCGRPDLPVALHVVEFYQPESARLPPFFIPMSASRGTLRGSIPVCSACCPPCGICLLPVVTPWIRRVVRALGAQHSGVGVSVGNGYCRHVHVLADVKSLFRPVRLDNGRPVQSPAEARDPVAGVSTKWRPRPFHHNKSKSDEAEWFANAPGWSLIDSRLIAVLIDRLHGNPMFEVFVHASQDCDVVAKYTALSALFDRGVGDVGALPRVAEILGTVGAEDGAKFSDLVKSKRASDKALGRLYENAVNACEASVHVEPNYLPSYVHLAVLRSMLNRRDDAMAFCNKGLEAVARLRRAPFHRSELPAIKNAGQDLDTIEKHLMSIKASLKR